MVESQVDRIWWEQKGIQKKFQQKKMGHALPIAMSKYPPSCQEVHKSTYQLYQNNIRSNGLHKPWDNTNHDFSGYLEGHKAGL